MPISTLPITPFDVRGARERDYAALNHFQNVLRAERLPDDPPMPLPEAMAMWRNIPALVDARHWVVWSADGARIVAHGECEWMRTEDNRHLAFFYVQVLPSHRRHGLARGMLAPIVEAARADNRRLLETWTSGNVPAGEAFVRRLGAKLGAERHRNQLLIAAVNRDLMRAWIARGLERATAFELGLWVGSYPDADLAAIVALNDAMNDEPRDGMDMEDHHKGPEEIRQNERQMAETGTERWTMFVRERATGIVAGYSEVFWNPNRPQLLNQGATGVLPAYRNNGLARWLKAAMFEKVVRDRPQVTRIRTGNADSNAPMLKINFEMGFTHYISQAVWQVETEQVSAYLASG